MEMNSHAGLDPYLSRRSKRPLICLMPMLPLMGRPRLFSHHCKNASWVIVSPQPRSCPWLSDDNFILQGRAAELSTGGTQERRGHRSKILFWKEFIRESVTCFFPLRSQILQLLGPAGWSGGFGDAMSGLKCPDMEGIQGPHPRGCFSPLNI